MQLGLVVPDELVEQIAARAAELVLERLQNGRSAGPEFLTVEETAELLRCKKQRVYELTSARKLPTVKDGGRVLIRRVDVDVYLGLECSGLRRAA